MTHDLDHQDTPNFSPSIATNTPKIKKKRRKETGLCWFDDPHSTVKGESGLWIAVIAQALVDALCKSTNSELLYLKDEAIRWLTSNNKDFTHVCYLAGLDPDYVRRKAKKAIISPNAWRAAPGFGKRYIERKISRQKAKEKKLQKLPHEDTQTIHEGCIVIPGPWSVIAQSHDAGDLPHE